MQQPPFMSSLVSRIVNNKQDPHPRAHSSSPTTGTNLQSSSCNRTQRMLDVEREMQLSSSSSSAQPSGGGGGGCPTATPTPVSSSSSSALALSDSADSALGRSLLSAHDAHDSPPATAALTPCSTQLEPGCFSAAIGATSRTCGGREAEAAPPAASEDVLKLEVDMVPDSLPPGWVLCNDGDEEMGNGGVYYWHVSSGTIQREPPTAASASAAALHNANASASTASSCVRFEASALSRSLFLVPADCFSSPLDLFVPATSPPPLPASLLHPPAERQPHSETEKALLERPLSVFDKVEAAATGAAERHPNSRSERSSLSLSRRPLDNPFTTDAAECRASSRATATGSHSRGTAHAHAHARSHAPGDQHTSAALARRGLDSSRSKTEPTPSPKHAPLPLSLPLPAAARDDSGSASAGASDRVQVGGAGAERESAKRASANLPGSSFYTLCFAPSTDFEDALGDAEAEAEADADADELEPSRVDCTASATATAVPILALQQSIYDARNVLEPTPTCSSTSSTAPSENQLQQPHAELAAAAGGVPVRAPPTNESLAQLLPRAGLCTGFMSASVIGAEGLSAMQMQMGNCGRARAGPCRPGAGVARLRSCGLHRLSAPEMATREAAQAAVSARILTLLRPTPHYRSRTKPALPLPPAPYSNSNSNSNEALSPTTSVCGSSSTPNGAHNGTSVSVSVSIANGLRVAVPVPVPDNGFCVPAAAGASLEAQVDCSETDGCHLVLRCAHTQRVLLRESLRTIRFWGIGGPHDRFFAYVKRESPASLSSSSEADADADSGARCLADADVEQLLACPPPLATVRQGHDSDGLVNRALNAVRAISVPRLHTSSIMPAHSSATASTVLHSERQRPPQALARAPKSALNESRSKKPSQVPPTSQSTSTTCQQQEEVREALTVSTELLELECCAASSLSSSSTDSQSSRGKGFSSSASSGPLLRRKAKAKTKTYVCHVLRSERALREFAALFQQHWLRCRTSGAARARRERCKRLEERAHATLSTAGEAANNLCTQAFHGVLATRPASPRNDLSEGPENETVVRCFYVGSAFVPQASCVNMFQSGVERVLAAATSPARQQQPRLSRVVHLGDPELDSQPPSSPSSTSSPSPSTRLLSRLITPPPWLSSTRSALLGGKRTVCGSGTGTGNGNGMCSVAPDTCDAATATSVEDRSSLTLDSLSDSSLLHAPVEASVSKQALYVYTRESPFTRFVECRLRFLSFLGIYNKSSRYLGFIMHTAADRFELHVLCCESTAATLQLARAIQFACRERFAALCNAERELSRENSFDYGQLSCEPLAIYFSKSSPSACPSARAAVQEHQQAPSGASSSSGARGGASQLQPPRPLSSVAALGGTLRSALSALSGAGAEASPRVLGRRLGQALRSRLGLSASATASASASASASVSSSPASSSPAASSNGNGLAATTSTCAAGATICDADAQQLHRARTLAATSALAASLTPAPAPPGANTLSAHMHAPLMLRPRFTSNV